MKKINGKYIRLTENELKEIVKNEVKRQLSIIMEYAIPRSKFIENAYNLSQQIIENWCLIHYCTIIERTETKEHWKTELYAHMNNVSRSIIKANNSYETRLKALKEAFDWNDLYDSEERVSRIISGKFKIEKIPTNTSEYLKCVNDCFNSIDAIVDVMAKFDPSLIEDYIETI